MAKLEILFLDEDWVFGRLDEVTDPLDEALMEAGVGDVTGGGIGRGVTRIELELTDAKAGIGLVRRYLAEIGAPSSTRLRYPDGRLESTT